MMVVFLGMMYCVTAPFLPVCGVFFAVFTSSGTQLCYHYMQPYQSGQTLWGWLMKNTFTCLMVSQVILLLGLPTLVDPVKGEYTADYIRLALLPLPFVSTMQMLRTKDILKQSHKVPVHKQAAETGEREDENEAERNTSFDERGVVGDLGALLTTTRSPAKLRQAADSAPGKKTFNVVGEGAMKYTKKMNTGRRGEGGGAAPDRHGEVADVPADQHLAPRERKSRRESHLQAVEGKQTRQAQNRQEEGGRGHAGSVRAGGERRGPREAPELQGLTKGPATGEARA